MKRFSPYLIISLLASTLGFGATKGDSSCRPKDQCCPKTPKIEMAPAYSAPANVHLACKRDVWVDVSFIYWQPIGENLELGIADHNTGDSDAEAGTPLVGEVVNMDFRFKPGFQVGLGVDFGCDDWDAYAQYTYLRSTDTVTSEGFTPGQIHSLWVSPAVLLDEEAPIYGSGSATWRADFDLVDASVGRWYYSGKKLTFHPFFGLRAAFIRQNYDTEFEIESGVSSNTTDQSHSWAIGPRTGVDSNWMIGKGFRAYGNGSADILYTSYKIHSTQSGIVLADSSVDEINVRQNDLGYLRTHLDLELGLGWERYLRCNKLHVDLSAGYGFQVFFGQIMFRRWLDDIDIGKSFNQVSNLFIQGLTARARLDF